MSRLALSLAVVLVAMAAVPALAPAAPPSDQYIVVLERAADAPQVAREHRDRHGASLKHVYGRALNGYAARIPAGRLDAVRRDARVLYVERDAEVRASETTQSSATWGLDRVDQRLLPLSGTYTYSAAGTGVTAFVIDTGIRSSHTDFGGRVGSGYTAIADGRGTSDCNGHGTHVAGTVGGATYGVAKGVSLVPVRVLDCNGSGTVSGVIAGVDWVTASTARPAVANMSLGGGASSSLDTAVKNSIAGGVSYSLAAGNEDADACTKSPARVTEGLTIGATTSADARPSWSNWGACVDWFAPGASITSAYHSSDTATYTMSGTSMAAPHTAGAAALHLQSQPSATPSQVASHLGAALTTGIVTSAKTANNHLLFVGDATAEPAPAPSTPISLSATGSKVKGVARANLSWSGTTATSVDIYRNGAKRTTVSNTGSYTDQIGKGAGGSYTYKVCEAGTTTCSNDATVTF